MQNEEQKLIDDLFNRLKQAETQSAPRDQEAEQRIHQHLQSQPGAPYYMAQAIIIQEAAINKLNDRVTELENRIARQPEQSSGGFLAGLFGGGAQRPQSPPVRGSDPVNTQPAGYTSQPAAARGTGFLGGALQTAVGVAGGVVMADMLTHMFLHSPPEEIVNIINQPPPEQPDYDADQSVLNQDAHASDFSQNSWDDASADNGGDGFFGDSGDDNDSFL